MNDVCLNRVQKEGQLIEEFGDDVEMKDKILI